MMPSVFFRGAAFGLFAAGGLLVIKPYLDAIMFGEQSMNVATFAILSAGLAIDAFGLFRMRSERQAGLTWTVEDDGNGAGGVTHD